MANLFKSLDTGGFISTLRDFGLAIRQFFATKSEMDVVATALTDLDRRIPTITVGKVTTVDASKDADVKNVGTSQNVVLDFYIPRGEQGDMKELDDAGKEYCYAEIVWQMRPNTNFTFADAVRVPVPSLSAMYMLADCIKQTNDITLNMGKTSIGSYVWSQLHWYKQCSRDSGMVYTTKYATPDQDFPSIQDSQPTTLKPPSIIEISVKYNKSDGSRYVQITIENRYGRAYYVSNKIEK